MAKEINGEKDDAGDAESAETRRFKFNPKRQDAKSEQ